MYSELNEQSAPALIGAETTGRWQVLGVLSALMGFASISTDF
nr:hypothetical protein [Rhizobium sp. ACO-34A]